MSVGSMSLTNTGKKLMKYPLILGCTVALVFLAQNTVAEVQRQNQRKKLCPMV